MGVTGWCTQKARSTAARLSRMALCLAMLCLWYVGGLLQAKSVQVTQLEAEISQLNKQAEYETSLKKVLDFLNAPAIPEEDA